MTGPGATGRRPAAARLAGIGLLGAGVVVALYLAGRLHTPNYNFSLFGRVGLGAVMLKSTLASIALGAAALQVLLALWIYRKLPLAGSPPRPVPLAHRIVGFALFALTVPIALHCLIAYGVQLTSVRVAVHSLAGCFFYGAFVAKVLLVQSRRLPGWALPVALVLQRLPAPRHVACVARGPMPPAARRQTQARPGSRWPRVERHAACGCDRGDRPCPQRSHGPPGRKIS